MSTRKGAFKLQTVVRIGLWVCLLAVAAVVFMGGQAGAEPLGSKDGGTGSDGPGVPGPIPTVIPTLTVLPQPSGTVQPGQTVTANPQATNTPAGAPSPVPTSQPPTCSISFSDVSTSDWFYEPVAWLVCNGIASGYGDGTFRPAAYTTRAQMSKMAVLAAGWELVNPETATFSDVEPGSTFYTVVETAYRHGLVNGYPDGGFRPSENVTRGQLCKLTVLARGWTLETPGTATFTDVPTGSAFFSYVETAVRKGVVTGYADVTFRPGNNATRAQIAKIVFKAFTTP